MVHVGYINSKENTATLENLLIIQEFVGSFP